MAKLNQEDILAFLEEATILELNELVKAIEEKFGVTAAAPVAVAAVAEAEGPAEPTEVTVTLTDIGATKVKVIKVVKDVCGLSLIEAKKLVDSCPAKIKENIAPAEAEELKKALVEAGATVEVK